MSVPADLVATEPIIRARLRKVTDKQYRHGVLGLRAEPVWDGGGFTHDGTPVTVLACPSVLTIWEAIDTRNTDGWTVVLTNVDDDELGDTVLAHLLDARLFTPDPWEALRSNFSASTIEPALYRSDDDRAVANGLLATLSGNPPAPGGVLTLDHAMAALSREMLGIVKHADVEIDTLAILEWSRSQLAPQGLAVLRDTGGPELTAMLGAWLAGRAGPLSAPLTALLAGDRIADLVPLGVIAGLFGGTDTAVALGVFLGRFGLTGLGHEELAAWHAAARSLLTGSLDTPQQQAVLEAAAAVVTELGIGAAASASDLLSHGLHARVAALAEVLSAALPKRLPDDIDGPLVATAAVPLVEDRWAAVQQHFAATGSPTVAALGGAVRLVRWLAEPIPPISGLSAAFERHVGSDSWVDSALVQARRGADQPAAAAALRAVIDAVTTRRAHHDRVFAAALADAPEPPVPVIENVLRQQVFPVAKDTRILLLVVDALSLAAANDLVAATQHDGWIEVSREGRRGAALAVLPTLTQRSRCSLLCGELREGGDAVERSGFLSLLRDAGRQATGGVPDPIFHKRALDAIPSGALLATDVGNAVADTTRQPVVAAVLNYVDDTLHHTNPGGTDWNLTTITHLRPLLDAAKNAGRTVIITSDHGHIIEYGTSIKVNRANTYGQRAHGDVANVDPDREVLIDGPRVLTDDQQVVLAVDETVRYSARNAGYHGGGTPAEAVVPVIMLVAGRVPDWAEPVLDAEPPWWHPAVVESAPVRITRSPQSELSLFDAAPKPASALPDKVVRSKVFEAQLELAGRVVLKKPQFKNLLAALVGNDAHEITVAQAASVLGVVTASINGALMQAKRVLDVEGYEVLRVGGGVVGLDIAALKEQFGIGP